MLNLSEGLGSALFPATEEGLEQYLQGDRDRSARVREMIGLHDDLVDHWIPLIAEGEHQVLVRSRIGDGHLLQRRRVLLLPECPRIEHFIRLGHVRAPWGYMLELPRCVLDSVRDVGPDTNGDHVFDGIGGGSYFLVHYYDCESGNTDPCAYESFKRIRVNGPTMVSITEDDLFGVDSGLTGAEFETADRSSVYQAR